LLLASLPPAGGRPSEKLSVALPGDSKGDPPTVPANALGVVVIAPTPRNFPRSTPADIQDTFRLLPDVAQGVLMTSQWAQEDRVTSARNVIALARAHGVSTTSVVGLSPLSLDKSRKELDLPKALRGKRRSFADKDVRAGFIAAARELARLEPPYLCLGTEVNFLGLHRPDEYQHFVKLYKEAYREVKKLSPKTRVFVSFQYDWIRIADHRAPGKASEHARKTVDVFRPELDLVAITSYPAEFYPSPADMPGNYYTYFRDTYLKPTDEVMVMEIGWPSAGKGSEQTQEQFVRRLPALMAGLKPTVTAWALLHDVKVPAFDANLATTGLLTGDGKEKRAYAAWKDLARAARAAKRPGD
jgi:hypothetical protein